MAKPSKAPPAGDEQSLPAAEPTTSQPGASPPTAPQLTPADLDELERAEHAEAMVDNEPRELKAASGEPDVRAVEKAEKAKAAIRERSARMAGQYAVQQANREAALRRKRRGRSALQPNPTPAGKPALVSLAEPNAKRRYRVWSLGTLERDNLTYLPGADAAKSGEPLMLTEAEAASIGPTVTLAE